MHTLLLAARCGDFLQSPCTYETYLCSCLRWLPSRGQRLPPIIFGRGFSPPPEMCKQKYVSASSWWMRTHTGTHSLMSLQTRTRVLRSSLRDVRNQWKPFFTFTFDFQVKVSNVFMSLAPSPIFVYAVLMWFNGIPLQTHTHTNNHLTAFCPGLPG